MIYLKSILVALCFLVMSAILLLLGPVVFFTIFFAPGKGEGLHQRIVTRLTRFLSGFVEDHQLGEVYVSPFDVAFSPFDVVEPDLVYISDARESVLTEMNVQGAPDLVVEVLSETTEKTDRTIKPKLYGKIRCPGVLDHRSGGSFRRDLPAWGRRLGLGCQALRSECAGFANVPGIQCAPS
jgi:hypothetical protein